MIRCKPEGSQIACTPRGKEKQVFDQIILEGINIVFRDNEKMKGITDTGIVFDCWSTPATPITEQPPGIKCSARRTIDEDRLSPPQTVWGTELVTPWMRGKQVNGVECAEKDAIIEALVQSIIGIIDAEDISHDFEQEFRHYLKKGEAYPFIVKHEVPPIAEITVMWQRIKKEKV